MLHLILSSSVPASHVVMVGCLFCGNGWRTVNYIVVIIITVKMLFGPRIGEEGRIFLTFGWPRVIAFIKVKSTGEQCNERWCWIGVEPSLSATGLNHPNPTP